MYHLLVPLADPSRFLPLFLAGVLAVLWYRHKEARRRLLWLAVPGALLLVLFLPAASYLALGSLEWGHPPLEDVPEDAGAIVVLSGSVEPADPGGARFELADDTLRRCLCAQQLYLRCRRPVLVSGGKVDPAAPGPACAPLMRDFLVAGGVRPDDILVEDGSRTTHENAVESARLLKEREIRKVVLVTDAAHLPRALGCFRKQGLDPVGAGCRYRAIGLGPEDFFPDPAAVGGWQAAWHEWLGLAWYQLNGRL